MEFFRELGRGSEAPGLPSGPVRTPVDAPAPDAPVEAPGVRLFMPDHGHGAPDGTAVMSEGAAALAVLQAAQESSSS